ncbi:MAG TPA: DUF6356 family protein [Steroidobacteraceae bacterium]|nr:DUF6356 family protein [Steroidobacteraceae bacterium]
MEMGRLFTAHPAEVGETYFEHLLRAASFGTRMMFAGGACLIHALFPFLFVKTGSLAIADLHNAMVTNRRRVAAPLPGKPVTID